MRYSQPSISGAEQTTDLKLALIPGLGAPKEPGEEEISVRLYSGQWRRGLPQPWINIPAMLSGEQADFDCPQCRRLPRWRCSMIGLAAEPVPSAGGGDDVR
jgi:hypothetical protein